MKEEIFRALNQVETVFGNNNQTINIYNVQDSEEVRKLRKRIELLANEIEKLNRRFASESAPETGAENQKKSKYQKEKCLNY